MIYAHKLCDSLRNGSIVQHLAHRNEGIGINRLCYKEISNQIISDINDSQKFKIGNIAELVNLKTGDLAIFRDYIKLPYDKSYFEIFSCSNEYLGSKYDVDRHCFIYAESQGDGNIHCRHFYRIDKKFIMPPIMFSICFTSENSAEPFFVRYSPYYIFDLDHNEIEQLNHFDAHKDSALLACNALIRALIMINCSNITYIDKPPSKSLNASRLKKKKTPFFSYKILDLETASRVLTRTNREDDDVGARNSPRIHLRRGHVRKYEDGSLIWVNPCIVGSKKMGVIQKDYAVN